MSVAVMLHSSHGATFNLYSATSSDMGETCFAMRRVQHYREQRGPERERASVGIANDGAHLLYGPINAAISLFSNSQKRQRFPPQLHSFDCCGRRKLRQVYAWAPNVEIFILTKDKMQSSV